MCVPSPRSLVLGPANLRPQNDDRGRRGVLGAASLGTVVGVRCAVGVQGSPTGRGAGSLCHAPPFRRALGDQPKVHLAKSLYIRNTSALRRPRSSSVPAAACAVLKSRFGLESITIARARAPI